MSRINLERGSRIKLFTKEVKTPKGQKQGQCVKEEARERGKSSGSLRRHRKINKVGHGLQGGWQRWTSRKIPSNGKPFNLRRL